MSRKRRKLINTPHAASKSNVDYIDYHSYDNEEPNYQRELPKRRQKPAPLTAKTAKQKEYIDAIYDSPQIVVCGPAGVGKTYIAARIAAEMLANKEVDKIVISRPNVSSSKSIGYVPGDKNMKFQGWAIPILEVLKEYLGEGAYDYYLKNEKIELVPFEYMRGRSFNNCFVIVDEFQSTTIDEAICIVTRIGENSKLILMGDVRQKDIKQEGGLEFVTKMVKTRYNLRNFVKLIDFDLTDVVRSGVCSAWVYEIYD